jgi:nucleoside-diphosphate-sugar epimerase
LSSTHLDYSSLKGRTEIHIKDFRHFVNYEGAFDEIYHLASPVGSLGILEKSGYIAQDILELAKHAANIAADSNARLLYVSSSEVYGKDGEHREDSEQIVPRKRGTRMEYALGKLTAEHMLINRAHEDCFQLRIVRPFNAMGEWQSSQIGFVIPKFFESSLCGYDLTVYGNGQQLRSFCHVDDLVNGIITIQTKGKDKFIYNVGHPDNVISIDRLAYTIKHLCKSQSKIVYLDPRELHGSKYIEAFNKIPNIDRALYHTEWKPTINLAKGLQRIYRHYIEGDVIYKEPNELPVDLSRSYSPENVKSLTDQLNR